MSVPQFFDVRIEGNTLVVVSLGSVGSLAGDDMNYELAGLLDEFEKADLRNAVIDLACAPYFGTSMLQVMTALWKRVRARGGKMAVCRVSDTGMEIFQVTRFDTLWPVCASQEEALKAVTQP
jgi:anti-anti-sigma factor